MKEDKTSESKDKEPTKESGSDSSAGAVTIPEDFQKNAHDVVKQCKNEQMCDHITSLVSAHRMEMHKAKDKMEKGKNPKTMGAFSSEEMPND